MWRCTRCSRLHPADVHQCKCGRVNPLAFAWEFPGRFSDWGILFIGGKEVPFDRDSLKKLKMVRAALGLPEELTTNVMVRAGS